MGLFFTLFLFCFVLQLNKEQGLEMNGFICFQNGPIFTGEHFEKQGGHAAFSVEMFIETNCALILIKKVWHDSIG